MLAGQSHPENGGAYFRHTGDSACEDKMSARNSPIVSRQPRVVGARVGVQATHRRQTGI